MTTTEIRNQKAKFVFYVFKPNQLNEKYGCKSLRTEDGPLKKRQPIKVKFGKK